MNKRVFCVNFFVVTNLICRIYGAPQVLPETNNVPLEITNETETTVFIRASNNVPEFQNEIAEKITTVAPENDTNNNAIDTTNNATAKESNIIKRLYKLLSTPLKCFIKEPKVTSVLRNIGTCMVNGAMEIIIFYIPTPMIPLITSLAGMLIPFEPVVMLKDRIPVTSYRKAFQTAVKSFLGIFDKYRYEDTNIEDDPYMALRFNRRFMNDKSGEKIKKLID